MLEGDCDAIVATSSFDWEFLPGCHVRVERPRPRLLLTELTGGPRFRSLYMEHGQGLVERILSEE